jgi:ribosome biogenesis GTPase / thiamine phosphate phosphatase
VIRKRSGTPDPQLLAANVDVVFIVTAQGGDFNLPRMKRYLALVQQSGATPVIVVNKSDLGDEIITPAGGIDGISPEVPTHVVGARASDGLYVLEQYFQGNRTVALAGCQVSGTHILEDYALSGTAGFDHNSDAEADGVGASGMSLSIKSVLMRTHAHPATPIRPVPSQP